jgi:hypothetical protein
MQRISKLNHDNKTKESLNADIASVYSDKNKLLSFDRR